LRTFQADRDPEDMSDLSPDGLVLAEVRKSGTIAIGDTTNGNRRNIGRSVSRAIRLTFSPDGKRILVRTNADEAVRDLQSLRLAGTLEGHANDVNDASRSPDGRRIVKAS
jgi:WD40 repeat protein